MTFGLQTIAEREAALLAPYAFGSAHSRGRKHPELSHAYRGPFQRDRDRILHSSAFRRLSGKMQVFTGDRGDYHRTRLTHTHEVASIARTIGRALRLNEDLIEALALFHDLGHPPFGHAGEDALDDILQLVGGFSHNEYALTIAEQLEQRYPAFPGLNLTYEVLEGQATRIDKSAMGAKPSLWEVQVVEAADSMTYDAHDTDDAVKLGLVSLPELERIQLVKDALAVVRGSHANVPEDALRKAVVHELIDRQVSELLATVGDKLLRHPPQSAEEASSSGVNIGPGEELAEQKVELEMFLYDRVYRHPQLLAVRSQAQERLRAIFDAYAREPQLLPLRFQRRAQETGLSRSIGDYLAGMTDRFCDQQYERVVARP
jgi:dGTPase